MSDRLPQLHVIALLFSNTVVILPNQIDLCFFLPNVFFRWKRKKTNEKFQAEVEEKVMRAGPFFSSR